MSYYNIATATSDSLCTVLNVHEVSKKTDTDHATRVLCNSRPHQDVSDLVVPGSAALKPCSSRS